MEVDELGIYGEVQGIETGRLFNTRRDMTELGIHRPLRAGMSVGHRGAFSLIIGSAKLNSPKVDSDDKIVLLVKSKFGSTRRYLSTLRKNIENATPIRIIRAPGSLHNQTDSYKFAGVYDVFLDSTSDDDHDLVFWLVRRSTEADRCVSTCSTSAAESISSSTPILPTPCDSFSSDVDRFPRPSSPCASSSSICDDDVTEITIGHEGILDAGYEARGTIKGESSGSMKIEAFAEDDSEGARKGEPLTNCVAVPTNTDIVLRQRPPNSCRCHWGSMTTEFIKTYVEAMQCEYHMPLVDCTKKALKSEKISKYIGYRIHNRKAPAEASSRALVNDAEQKKKLECRGFDEIDTAVARRCCRYGAMRLRDSRRRWRNLHE